MSETREQELRRLIREQRADDVPIQRPEPMTQPLGLAVDFLDENGQLVAGVKRSRFDSSCPIHGHGEQAILGNGVLRCRACHREAQRSYRARRR